MAPGESSFGLAAGLEVVMADGAAIASAVAGRVAIALAADGPGPVRFRSGR